MKHKVVYRTKDVTLIDGAIKDYRFTAYHETVTGIRVSFLPYTEENLAVVFELRPEGGFELENPEELLDYVEFFSGAL
jgi:hypothetical protein